MTKTALATLREQLRFFESEKAEQPHSNPVSRLAHQLHKALDQGHLSLEDLQALIKEIGDKALQKRAKRLGKYIGLDAIEKRRDTLLAFAEEKANQSFSAFKTWLEHPKFGFVLTAHPTFLLSKTLSKACVQYTLGKKVNLEGMLHKPDRPITLEDEHQRAQQSLALAREAQHKLVIAILKLAKKHFPETWHQLNPRLLTLASWVGYDYDGRTDIRWHDSFNLRLKEKVLIYADYSARLKALGFRETNEIAQKLDAQSRTIQEIIEALEDREASQSALPQIADTLYTTNRKKFDKAALLAKLDACIDSKSSCELVALRSYIKTHGFGSGLIHLRVNAVQLHNALDGFTGFKQTGGAVYRTDAQKLSSMLDQSTIWQVNFADLSTEKSTAIRQLLFATQVLKHVDSDAPIRFLIAECENPLTVLIALYFAKRFGIDQKIDISPLFETPNALQVGARLIERLLENPLYVDYVQKRKKLCIQAGFSDAGRFLGQIPATLAIERLQIQLARAIERKGLRNVHVLIFNTHGESMGRGAHPSSLEERLGYVFTPYARAAYACRNISVSQETSIQGGDGYLMLGEQRLAEATLTSALVYEWHNHHGQSDDPFYKDKAFALDFFLALKKWQEGMYHQEEYRTVLGAFGTNLLYKTGSRATKRSKTSRDPRSLGDPGLLRAIPHNASLQQLGIPANVIAGLGITEKHERAKLSELLAQSTRLQSLFLMVSWAKERTSLDALGAYADLFSPLTWTNHLQYIPKEQIYSYERLAQSLEHDTRRYGLRDFVSQMQRELHNLEPLLSHIDSVQNTDSQETLALLHALRIALIKYLWVKAASLPRFTPGAGVRFADVMRETLSLNIIEATQMMRDAFPLSENSKNWQKKIREPSNYGTQNTEQGSYDALNRECIDPLLTFYDTIRQISVGIAHIFSAHG